MSNWKEYKNGLVQEKLPKKNVTCAGRIWGLWRASSRLQGVSQASISGGGVGAMAESELISTRTSGVAGGPSPTKLHLLCAGKRHYRKLISNLGSRCCVYYLQSPLVQLLSLLLVMLLSLLIGLQRWCLMLFATFDSKIAHRLLFTIVLVLARHLCEL